MGRIAFTTFRPILVVVTILICASTVAAQGTEKILPITLSGGHEIGPKDHGRPVVLIAAALDVSPDVFRKAFDGVTPARGGPPTEKQARSNKAALMKVLKPYGVTNERLDEVSNYYRFQPQRGELWKTTPAKAHAVVKEGRILRIELTEPGSGYSSLPKATIEGMEKIPLNVTLKYDKDLKKNGAIGSIEVAPAKAGAPRR